MELQAGKRYRRRNGTITPPLEHYNVFLLDPETGFVFDNGLDGNFVCSYFVPYGEDLLEEADE